VAKCQAQTQRQTTRKPKIFERLFSHQRRVVNCLRENVGFKTLIWLYFIHKIYSFRSHERLFKCGRTPVIYKPAVKKPSFICIFRPRNSTFTVGRFSSALFQVKYSGTQFKHMVVEVCYLDAFFRCLDLVPKDFVRSSIYSSEFPPGWLNDF
jgi:hypothetical protein